ncbi:MAG: amino acid adenylation domain-containing protein, partial [Desulfuromonadaceae bacterium]|nr:amino acid adenylation domain-containing protein [Desulfuromonadaceae bacterium]
PSGKADRNSLPHPEIGPSDAYVAPKTEEEKLLCALFEQILQIEKVGTQDNFFAMGGDSILALQVIAQARRRGFDLNVRDLFKSPTVEGLAVRLASRRNLREEKPAPVKSSLQPPPEVLGRLKRLYPDLETALPLTPLQQGILFHSLESPGAYQVQLCFRIEGIFDTQRFAAAWKEVLGRHQILRMAVPDGETAFMAVIRRAELPFTCEDWRGRNKPEDALQDYILHDRKRGFDLSHPPLLRLGVLQMADHTWEVVFNSHHLTLDGWSLSVVMTEVLKLYDGEPLSPPALFQDYAAWLHSRPMEPSLAWWREVLTGFDKPNRIDLAMAEAGEGFGEETRLLNAALADRIDRVARELRTTRSTLLQALWGILIGHLSGAQDIVFGNVVSGRPAQIPHIEKMAGMFINTVPVRVRTEERTLRAILSELTAMQGEREEHEYAPLHQVQAQAPIPRGMPLFESLFVYENYPVDERLVASRNRDFTITDSEGVETPPYPLTLTVLPGRDLVLKLGHDRQRCDQGGAANILRWFEHLAVAALDRIDGRVCDLPLTDAAEFELVVHRFNDTAADFPRDKTLHLLFEEQAEKTPGNIAVRDSGRVLTYGELNAYANRISHALIARGVEKETLVGLCLERSVDLSAAILGIHKAGGAYVPLDPRYPKERFSLLCQDAGLELIIAVAATAPQFDGRLLLLDEDDLSVFPEDNPRVPVAADNLAYVIFTSGSTGRPKGVMVEHRGVVNRLFWLHHGLPYSPADVIMQKTPVTFDVSVPELYGGFVAGSSVCMLDPGAEKDPERIVETIEENGVTSIHFVASMLEAFLDHLQAVPSDIPRCATLNRVFTSGEAVSRGLVERYNRILRPATGAGLQDLYGPTEGTIEVSWYPCPKDTPAVKTIGKPVENTFLYILDGHGQPQPVGVPGELCIGGVQVARGYLNQPELTAEKFVPNPFASGRIYKTGDLARWLPSGEIEYLGRIDQQVKIRGFRIELGEIENALKQHPLVVDALVNPFGGKGEQRLCAYVVGDFEPGELRAHLAEKLPEYMVPAAFVKLDAIPLTPSGKADRKNLPHPEFQPKAGFTAPRTETEQALCALFASVLNIDRIGIHDNFFEAGGDSILALQVVSRARGQGIDLAVRDLFKAPDVEALAARARSLGRGGEFNAEKEAPLTPIQNWFFAQEGDKNHFNQSMLLRVPAGLDPAQLVQAMRRIVEHHDALRLRFRDGRQILQGMEAFVNPELVRRIDCRHLPPEERDAILLSEGEKAQQSLDIERGELFRCLWFDFGDEPGRLLWI